MYTREGEHLCQTENRGGAILHASSIKGGAGNRMRTEITVPFAHRVVILAPWKKRTKVIFLLCLLGLPGKVHFSEQSKGAQPLWIPPATSDPCGMVDTSTTQMMLNPIWLTNFLLWSLLFCLFLFCLVDFIMKMISVDALQTVHWLTSSNIQGHNLLR